MNKKQKIFFVLIIFWMIIVFVFSNEISDKSSGTSGKTIGFIIDTLSITKNMSEAERQALIETIQPPARKIAHFTIYAIGGILAFNFINEYKISIKKKILYSILFCLVYAITDEIHQIFVPGRSGEIRDILIDTLGGSTGIVVSFEKKKLFKKI